MRRRRQLAPSALSFLDCVCCGLGAILLLFVLTAGTKPGEEPVADLRARVERTAAEGEAALEEVRRLRARLAADVEARRRLEEALERDRATLADRRAARALLERERSRLEDELAALLDRLEAIPTTDVPVARPQPNPIRRQYLTDFRLDGQRVLFLVEASGSMLDETVEAARERTGRPEAERREAPKWKRTVASLEWILGTLRPPTTYRVVLFDRELRPIFPERASPWIPVSDRTALADALERLRAHAPSGPANLERAFLHALALDPPPDNLVLLVDGLPTAADGVGAGAGGLLDEGTRQVMLEAALRHLPRGLPVNVLLFPWSEDATAPALLWRLAHDTRGSFVSPARSWPDTTAP